MAEENELQGVVNPSRRRLLKRMAAAGSLVAAGVGLSLLFPQESSPEASDNSMPTLPHPEALPEDTLTEEELVNAHIRIIPTDDVKLHLRKGIFEFSLFRDAVEGKLDEAVIVLADNLSWNATRKLPEDVRLVWDITHESPKEKYETKLKLYKQILESDSKAFTLEEIASELDIMTKNPSEWLRLESENVYSSGHFVRGRDIADNFSLQGWRDKNFFAQHPEFKKRVYIFLAVGEPLAPHPKQSYLNPEQIEEYATNKAPVRRGYRFGYPRPAGFGLRHEIEHYEDDPYLGKTLSEYQVDTLAYDSFVRAWEEYQKTGDTSGYPFIFETKEGLIFTKHVDKPVEPTGQV